MVQVFRFVLLIVLVVQGYGLADDWPQWLGPGRDSVWREKGVAEKFPADGLPVKWRTPIELGYAGPAVVGNKVFVTDYVKSGGEVVNKPGGRTKLSGVERVLCLTADTGRIIWKHEYDCPYNVSYAGGPRCVPAVDSGKVYTFGAEGHLLCLNAMTGDVVWSKELNKEYNTETPFWGYAAHPLVDGDVLYLVVGGEGSIAVALNKDTGEEIWRALSCDSSGYCPPTMIQHGGVKQLLIWHPDALNSLNPKTGDVYWTEPLKPAYRMSVTAPRLDGDPLFVSGIGTVGALFKLDTNKPAAERVWTGTAKTAVYNCNSTPLLIDGVIYGSDCQLGALVGAKIEDGERLWQTFEPTSGGDRRASHGTAFLVRHEDRVFLFSETGDLILAGLSEAGYEEISRFHVLDPTNECFGRDVVWSHPAFASRCVFARNDKEIVCVSLANGN